MWLGDTSLKLARGCGGGEIYESLEAESRLDSKVGLGVCFLILERF
jgi:hypothetical protein